MNGFLLINKSVGPTSHDIVNQIRRITKEKRVGHAGTLDPFASGLLIVGVGRVATKKLGEFLHLDKTYEAEVRLGLVSDTGDLTGTVSNYRQCHCENNEPAGSEDAAIKDRFAALAMTKIQSVIDSFVGSIQQIPPMYSAKKVNGKKLYELARQGKEVERKPCAVTIHSINLLSCEWPLLKIRVHCGSGTYIRVLAQDIGQRLGVGGLCQNLIRTAIGVYQLTNAHAIDELTQENIQDYIFSY